MSNNNLKNCERAIASLNMVNDIKITIGKNPKQACRLTFKNGKDISVSAVCTVQQFIDLLESNKIGSDNSVAVSKYNNCNADDELEELTKWLERMATYAKKCCYNYDENTLTDIIAWTIEDWGFSAEQIEKYNKSWNSENGQKAKNNLMLFCNNRFTPYRALQMTIKQWLAHHGMYEHTDEQLMMIIKRYAERVGG